MFATRLRGPPAWLGLLLIAAVLSGCATYPAASGYAYAPVYPYAPAYGYYAVPNVSVGFGFGCCWGYSGFRGWYHPYWR